MNFEFAQQINPSLEKFNFSKALNIAETALAKIPETVFHSVLGKPFNEPADEVADWIETFYQSVSQIMDVEALYFEMNEFDINTDYWFIYGFAFSEDGGHDAEGMDWLSDVSEEQATTEEFLLTGYEDLQAAFANETLNTNDLEIAKDWCEQIIITRFMQLMRAAHLDAKERDLAWASIPIYFTEHEYDFILRSDD
jgi:hypothetical protein